jgi:hypothetical protein
MMDMHDEIPAPAWTEDLHEAAQAATRLIRAHYHDSDAWVRLIVSEGGDAEAAVADGGSMAVVYHFQATGPRIVGEPQVIVRRDQASVWQAVLDDRESPMPTVTVPCAQAQSVREETPHGEPSPAAGCAVAKETTVFVPGAYQIVVTHHDRNGLWKDFAVDQHDVIERARGVDDRELDCVVPTFWSSVSRSAQIQHVGVTINGRTVQLAWPPPRMASVARPALAMRLCLHHDPVVLSTVVSWQELPAVV